ncbi:MAG: host attachment protein [Myxococcales bacterium]|nr:host attachment protein [Myxococcales bacterium]
MKKPQWIVVAHRAGARFLVQDPKSRRLQLVEQRDHPEGRMRSGQLDTDAPGTASMKGSQGGAHPMAREQSAHDREAANFARELADALRGYRAENRFGELVLVAEPGFLGMLREALDGPTSACVAGTIRKDLSHVDLNHLGPHLAPE